MTQQVSGHIPRPPMTLKWHGGIKREQKNAGNGNGSRTWWKKQTDATKLAIREDYMKHTKNWASETSHTKKMAPHQPSVTLMQTENPGKNTSRTYRREKRT